MAMGQRTTGPRGASRGNLLTRRLESKTDFVAQDIGIARALRALAELHSLPIFLDRQIDPAHQLTVRINDAPLRDVLRELAQQANAAICAVRGVIYVGPQATTDRLATLVEMRSDQVKSLPPGARRSWTTSSRLQWEALATPRELVEELTRQCNAEVTNLERIPHDLLGARELPALPRVDQLSLLLAGFNLTFELDPQGRKVTLATLPEAATITRRYTLSGQGSAGLNQVRSRVPAATITQRGREIEVQGRYEDHVRVNRILRGNPSATRSRRRDPEKRYTLKVENQPVGAILKQLAASANLEVEVEPSAAPRLHDLVTFQVDQVRIERLLETCLQPSKLRFELSNSQLKVLSD